MNEAQEELIERMKNNRVPWKWLSEEDKDVLDKNIQNVVFWGNDYNYFQKTHRVFCNSVVYRIHKDYQPKPKKIEKLRFDGSFAYDTELENKINELIEAVNELREEK